MRLAEIRAREQAASSVEGLRQFPVTEVDEQGGVLPCNVCGNPNPGMSHRCTEFLFKDIKYLLGVVERHGQHTAGCSSLHSGGVYPCDCGWPEINKLPCGCNGQCSGHTETQA